MNIGDVVIIQKGNPYHDWEVRKQIEENKLTINRVKWVEKDIRKYRYSGILDDKEVLWLVVDKMTSSMRDELMNIRLKKRALIFEVETKAQKEWVQKMLFNGRSAEAYEAVNSWEEKKENCIKIVANMKVEFDSAETRNKLVEMMIREPESWKDVELGVTIVRNKGREITLRDLQAVYPTMDFYRLDDWIRDVIEGIKKQKTIKVAYYFTNEKEYSSVWLMQKVRERVEQIGVVYEAYRMGILYGTIPRSQMVERSKVMGWDGVDRLVQMKPSEISYCLRVIKLVPYRYFVEVQKVLFSGDEVVDKKWDVYRYIEELRYIRGIHDVNYGEQRRDAFRKHKKRRKG